MKRIFTLSFAALCALALNVNLASAQTASNPNTSTCTVTYGTDCNVPVTNNFDQLTPDVGPVRFMGDFEYGGAQSGNANSSSNLVSTTPFAPRKNLYSSAFTLNSPTQIAYTFTLSGNATVTSFNVALVDPNDTTIVLGQLCSGVVPIYVSSNAKVCISSAVPAGSYRLRFEFTIAGTGNSPNAVVTFDDFGLVNELNNIPLPVDFKSLSVRKDVAGARLTWEVANEVNIAQYVVERSNDARHFTTVNTVKANGSASYSVVDASPSSGLSYYRIKSLDTDGKFKFSTVVSYSNGKSVVVMKAFPLPAQNQITVQHEPVIGKGQLVFNSEDGRLMKVVAPAVGSTQTTVDVSNFRSGMYLVRFDNGNGQVETLKIIKQ